MAHTNNKEREKMKIKDRYAYYQFTPTRIEKVLLTYLLEVKGEYFVSMLIRYGSNQDFKTVYALDRDFFLRVKKAA